MRIGPMDDWRLWRYVAAADTNYASLKPSTVARPRGEKWLTDGIITVRDMEEIAIRLFGTDANNDTATLVIYGMMDNGPLQKILQLACVLGASSFSEPFIEEAPSTVQIPTSTAFFEADTYTEIDDLVGGSAPTASSGAGLIGSHYRIPTLGFKHLGCKILDIGGGGIEADKVGVIWRPTIPLR